MMRLLHWVMAPHSTLPPFPKAWGSTPLTAREHARISILYSDLGHSFYSQCGPDESVGEGWVVRSAFGTIWEIESAGLLLGKETASTAKLFEWKQLDISGVEALWKRDVAQMRDDLIKFVRTTGRMSFTFLPDEGVGTFVFPRSPLMPPFPEMNQWGVVLKDESDILTYATWTIDIRPPPPTLIITRLRATVAMFPYLLDKVWEVAKEHKMQQIEVWNLPTELEDVATDLGGKTTERQTHLPSFKIYGGEKVEEVEWLFNEK